MSADREFMTRALELAERGRGRTSPNPMVGCVVVRNGQIVGEGYHEQAGAPHAEVEAVRVAGDIQEATLYVTLEPCSHTGRTPPCTDLLRENRPARIVAAMEDPNPLVSGRGFEALRGAGCAVEVGLMEDAARRLNESFIKYVTTNTPFVIAKCAMSLDGKIATHAGDSRWVTSAAAREYVHRLRDEVDAIAVGSRTVIQDNPSLTARLPGGGGRDPIRVILGGANTLERGRRIFNLESSAPTWVAASRGEQVAGADEVIPLPSRNGALDLGVLMKELAAREVTSVLIEGGGVTLARAFEADVVDKVFFFVAPKIVGGKDAPTPVDGRGIARMADAVVLRDMQAASIGRDVLIEAYVVKVP